MIRRWAATVSLALAGPLVAEPPADGPRADDPPDFFSALGLPPRPNPDPWGVLGPAAPERAGTWAAEDLSPRPSFLPDGWPSTRPGLTPGDPGRWRYRQETVESLYRRTTSLEMPGPEEELAPYQRRDWTAEENVHIPVPVSVPLAEQLFVYGQLTGSGDTYRQQNPALSGKTGFGAKWSLLAGSQLQVRYATLFKYADANPDGVVQPSVELTAKVPLVGPLAVEYSGSALPAMTRAVSDQYTQELRFALPIRKDNELEFGARYRWESTPTPTPWTDRAQLFLGVKLRH